MRISRPALAALPPRSRSAVARRRRLSRPCCERPPAWVVSVGAHRRDKSAGDRPGPRRPQRPSMAASTFPVPLNAIPATRPRPAPVSLRALACTPSLSAGTSRASFPASFPPPPADCAHPCVGSWKSNVRYCAVGLRPGTKKSGPHTAGRWQPGRGGRHRPPVARGLWGRLSSGRGCSRRSTRGCRRCRARWSGCWSPGSWPRPGRRRDRRCRRRR